MEDNVQLTKQLTDPIANSNAAIESSIINFENAMSELAEKVGESREEISEKITIAKRNSINALAVGGVLIAAVLIYKKIRNRH